MPERIECKNVVKKCTQSATARVRINVGADAEGGVSLKPNQPAIPIPIMIEKMITNKVENVPVMLRVNKNNPIMIAAKASGIRFVISFLLASGKALFIITMPVV